MGTGNQEKNATAGRIVLLIGLAALLAVAAAALGRVFQGTSSALKLGLAAVIATGLAGALERRHIFLSALASAAALTILAVLLVFPSTTTFGLPTATSFSQVAHALGAVGRTAASEPSPGPLRGR